MSGSYFSALKERIGHQEVFEKLLTIDRFHLAKLIGEKVDKARKTIINHLHYLMPRTLTSDALHLAYASYYNMDFLLTG